MLSILEMRQHVDRCYIGFRPSTNSVKPVHIVSGLLRSLFGEVHRTKLLFSVAFPQDHKGRIPTGHDLHLLYEDLCSAGRMASQVNEQDFAQFRIFLRKVVGADRGISIGGMESYTAGSSRFLARDRIAQDGGALIGRWLLDLKSPLVEVIRESAQEANDPITLLCSPLLDDVPIVDDLLAEVEVSEIFGAGAVQVDNLWKGLSEAAATLAQHLRSHPSKLFRLRMVALFSSFVLLRHLSCLEARHVPGAPEELIPFLVAFQASRSEPIARGSLRTYTGACQAVSRFYAWSFGQYLKERYSLRALQRETPFYKGKGEKVKGRVDESKKARQIREMWEIALQSARRAEDPFTVCGQAIYDILATEAEGSPIGYMRNLGIRTGLLYPPINRYPAKQFRIGNDTLEMLLRGAVRPGDVVPLDEVQTRFWSRYGILIGGRPSDEEILVNSGVFQADSDSLDENRRRFGSALGILNFTNQLADGVLQVEVERSNAD